LLSADFDADVELDLVLELEELVLPDELPSEDFDPSPDFELSFDFELSPELEPSADLELESPSLEDDDEPARPLDDDDRESVTYQPLPLKTMPTGWITLRSAPPHCSQIVRGGSEKLWRFSIRSLQSVQV